MIAHPGELREAAAFHGRGKGKTIRQVFRGNNRVQVETFSGLLVRLRRGRGAAVIIRGLRAISDFEYEFHWRS